MLTPTNGPKSRPAASVNAVRGNGNTVITMWAAKNASGNHGPAAVAQSRSWIALGRGTRIATATRITIVAAMPTTRRRGNWVAVDVTAVQTVRNVVTTGFTSPNPTGQRAVPPTTLLLSSFCPPYAAVIPII